MSTQLRVGPFELGDEIGRGGMAAVHHARHLETDLPVAIKIVDRAVDADARRRFEREVRAQAELVHPGVVYLFEYGEIPETAAGPAVHDLVPESPYVAMELADGGTVRDRMPISSWESARSILAQVLDALAHSHAREIVHRDLKPENLLLFGGEEREYRVKLADFGVAHALGGADDQSKASLSTASGTPLYMAPEQARGEWRQFGPWTDLYALGCMAWELVCGRPPISGEGLISTLTRHQRADRPPLAPIFAVPPGLEEWIHTAMAIDRRDRFARAADAARAISELGPARGGRSRSSADDDVATAETLEQEPPQPHRAEPDDSASESAAAHRATSHRATTHREHLGVTLRLADREDSTSAGSEVGTTRTPAVGRSTPKIPQTWKPRRETELPSPLVGTGLGLFGLRETPFVDRDRERDDIWERLDDVARSGEPTVVVVVGDSGSGKSRLVEWMARRAHELGAANLFRALHTPGGESPSEGLAGLVVGAVHGYRLDRRPFFEHLLENLPSLEDSIDREVDARALTELVYPTSDDAANVDGPRYRFSSAGQKSAVVARLVRRYARRRPAFVWLDDMQWASQARSFLDFALKGVLEPPPALICATVRSEALSEDSALRAEYEEWREWERCHTIEIDALSSDDHRRFVESLLPLDQGLADRIASRTEGNPLFASQLVGDLVEREALEQGGGGFRLADDRALGLPDDIHVLWMNRLDRLVGDLEFDSPESVWRTLERTAVLGREVDDIEWRATVASIGLSRPDRLLDALIDRGLARHSEQGWSFTHALLVESIERHAREAGRLRDHHRECAGLLERLHSREAVRAASRRARHWLGAEAYERALAPLLTEFHTSRRLGDPKNAARTLERRREALDAAGVDAGDPRRLENELYLVRTRLLRGTPVDDLLEEIEGLRRRARAGDHDRLVALAEISAAHCQRRTAYRSARESLARAISLARETGEDELLLRALVQRAWLEYFHGNVDQAASLFERGRATAAGLEDRFEELGCLYGLAWVAAHRGETDRARDLFERVRDESREAGFRSYQADSWNGLGDLARFAGDGDRARECYRRDRELARELNHPVSLAFAHLNVAGVDLMERDFDAADRRLRRAERRLEELARLDEQIHILRAARAALAAGTGDWEDYDRSISHYREGWPDEAKLVKDHPWLWEMAGDYAAEAGYGDRAGDAWKLARELWDRLGNDDEATRVAAKLEE